MKVIVIGPVPPQRGGIAKATDEIGELLSKNNEVKVISFPRLYPAFFFKNSQLKETNQIKKYVEFPILDALNPFTWWNARNLIVRENPDRVIFVWWTTYLFPCYYALSKLLAKRTVTSALVHNVIPYSGED